MPSDGFSSLVHAVKAFGRSIGLPEIRIARPDSGEWGEHYRRWVEEGFAGEMAYMTRDPHRRSDPAQVMDDVQSVLIASMNYFPGDHRRSLLDNAERGYISNYALGEDYHVVLKEKLERVLEFIVAQYSPHPNPLPQGGRANRHPFSSMGEGEVYGKVYVDTGPILEKALAQKAGVGWIGKHTNLVTEGVGSWYFLGVILLNVGLPEDSQAPDRCGRCTRCIDICPTQAIVEPYVLDARRCISYLTIELKGSIPEAFRPLMGNRIFGCDDCQWVCPWNRFAREASESAFIPREDLDAPLLISLMSLSEEEFRTRFAGSPIRRIKRRGLLRNVAVALGNVGSHEAIPALSRALSDSEPLIREHAAWAIERITQRERDLSDQIPVHPELVEG